MAGEQVPLSAGALVRGRYAVKGVLSAGSAGTLYLVRDQKDQSPQAPSLVLKEISGLNQQERFAFTIRGTPLLQLSHPVLPRIHALLNDDRRGCIYLVLDYVDGERLAEAPWGYLNWPELRAWCEPIVAFLSYMHQQEYPLYHGDLKPETILRDNSGNVVLLDPGYLQPGPLDPELASCYHAPEQYVGILTARSDVYGCAALLYTLLTGNEPVDALTRQQSIGKKKPDPLVPAHKLALYLSREISHVLQSALSLDAAERFASVREFWGKLTELEALSATSQPTPAQSQSSLPAANILPLAPSVRPSTLPQQQVGAFPIPLSPITPIPDSTLAHQPGLSRSRLVLLHVVAIVLALVLLFSGAGAWLMGVIHPTSAVFRATPAPSYVSRADPTPEASGSIPVITGKYRGTFSPVTSSQALPRTFTLSIYRQQGFVFAGNFAAPLLSGSVTGSIDSERDVNWVLYDAQGRAILRFYGGLNGISPTQTNTLDNVGGVFYACAFPQDLQCSESAPGTAGSWSLSFISSA